MLNKFTKTAEMVLFELENRPETRSSDKLLMVKIYEDYFGVTKDDLFVDVLFRDDLPNFKTICRCRARIQAEMPSLRPGEDIIQFREENQQAFFNFFGGGIYE